jgi:hypothetical protein
LLEKLKEDFPFFETLNKKKTLHGEDVLNALMAYKSLSENKNRTELKYNFLENNSNQARSQEENSWVFKKTEAHSSSLDNKQSRSSLPPKDQTPAISRNDQPAEAYSYDENYFEAYLEPLIGKKTIRLLI